MPNLNLNGVLFVLHPIRLEPDTVIVSKTQSRGVLHECDRMYNIDYNFTVPPITGLNSYVFVGEYQIINVLCSVLSHK